MKKISDKLQLMTNLLTILIVLSGAFIYFKDKDIKDAIQTEQIQQFNSQLNFLSINFDKRFDAFDKRLDRIENKQDKK